MRVNKTIICSLIMSLLSYTSPSFGQGLDSYPSVGQTNPQFKGTKGIVLPQGTTAQRPTPALNGTLRYNTTTNKFEFYENGAWANAGGGSITTGNLLQGTGVLVTGGTGRLVNGDSTVALQANLQPLATLAANSLMGVNAAGTLAEYKTFGTDHRIQDAPVNYVDNTTTLTADSQSLVLIANATAPFTQPLPDPSTCVGKRFFFFNISGQVVTITTSGSHVGREFIQGSATSHALSGFSTAFELTACSFIGNDSNTYYYWTSPSPPFVVNAGSANGSSSRVVILNSNRALTNLAAGTSGQPLLSGGSAGAPAFGTLTTAFGGTGSTTFPSSGLITATAANTYTGRSLVATTPSIVIANANGVAGNPGIDTAQNIQTTASPTFAGLTLTNPLSISSGGTGLNAPGASNTIFGTDNAGTALEHKALTSLDTSVTITHGVGTIDLSVAGGFDPTASYNLTGTINFEDGVLRFTDNPGSYGYIFNYVQPDNIYSLFLPAINDNMHLVVSSTTPNPLPVQIRTGALLTLQSTGGDVYAESPTQVQLQGPAGNLFTVGNGTTINAGSVQVNFDDGVGIDATVGATDTIKFEVNTAASRITLNTRAEIHSPDIDIEAANDINLDAGGNVLVLGASGITSRTFKIQDPSQTHSVSLKSDEQTGNFDASIPPLAANDHVVMADNIVSTDGSVNITDTAGVVDLSTEVKHVRRVLSSAEILALNTTPITLIPAPGAGKIIIPQYVSGHLNFNSIAYVAGGNLELGYDGNLSTTVVVSFGTTYTTGESVLNSSAAGLPSGQVSTQVSNKGLQVHTASGDPTTGNSTYTIDVWYTVITP